MEKTIKIDGKEVRLVANGATPRLYRSLFGKDVFGGMQKAIDENGEIADFEVFENLSYTMAKQGGLDMDIDTWLSSMESPTALIEAVPDVIGLWTDTNATIETGKKK